MTRSTEIALALAIALTGASVAAAQDRGPAAEPAGYRAQTAAGLADVMTPYSADADGVASIVNVDGVKPGKLKLTAAVLAEIYQGRITRWDAAQIAGLNPGVALPHTPIVVVHSADTTLASQGFAEFLAARAPTYQAPAAPGAVVHWAVGVSAAGDADVAAAVNRTANSIGFVEYDFAREHGLSPARLIDGRSLPTTKLAPPVTPAERTRGDIAYRNDLPADLPMNNPR